METFHSYICFCISFFILLLSVSNGSYYSSLRLVEEADYQATAELFGAKTEAKSVDIFIPKSESDFLEYAEMISRKLVPYEVIPYSLSCLSYLIN